jgi:hypothetical protein
VGDVGDGVRGLEAMRGLRARVGDRADDVGPAAAALALAFALAPVPGEPASSSRPSGCGVRFHLGRATRGARGLAASWRAMPTKSPSVTTTAPARLSMLPCSIDASVAPIAGGRSTLPWSSSDGANGPGRVARVTVAAGHDLPRVHLRRRACRRSSSDPPESRLTSPAIVRTSFWPLVSAPKPSVRSSAVLDLAFGHFQVAEVDAPLRARQLLQQLARRDRGLSQLRAPCTASSGCRTCPCRRA